MLKEKKNLLDLCKSEQNVISCLMENEVNLLFYLFDLILVLNVSIFILNQYLTFSAYKFFFSLSKYVFKKDGHSSSMSSLILFVKRDFSLNSSLDEIETSIYNFSKNCFVKPIFQTNVKPKQKPFNVFSYEYLIILLKSCY